MQQNEENVLDKKLIWLYSVLTRNALGGETMNINARVADIILAKKGMTRTALAEKSGITRQTVSAILRRGTCSAINAGKLANALGIQVEELMEVKE